MKKKILLSSAIALSAIIASCGGSGSESPTSGTQPQSQTVNTGVFVDAPVEGVNYLTTSGQAGTTNANGEFKYIEGDEVSFFIGNVWIAQGKANKVVTPLSLMYDKTKDYAKAKDLALKLVALLLSLDSDPSDNKITIPQQIKDEFKNTNNQILTFYDSTDTDLQSISFNVNGQNYTLYDLVSQKINESQTHIESSLFTLMQNFLYNALNKKMIVNNETCNYTLSTTNYITIECPSQTYQFSFTKKDGTIYSIMNDGQQFPFISITDDEACMLYQNSVMLCFEIGPSNTETSGGNNNTQDNNTQDTQNNTDIPQYVQNLFNTVNIFFESKAGKTATLVRYDGTRTDCNVPEILDMPFTLTCNDGSTLKISYTAKSDYVYITINGNEYRMGQISSLAISWNEGLAVNVLY